MDRPSSRPLVLVTRPQESGSLLAARLRELGVDAMWWPAFDLLGPEDAAALESCLTRLADFDLVIFVSPAAVHATAGAWRRFDAQAHWPAATRIATVGAATRDAALESLPGAREAQIICPAGDTAADGGSEALISAIRQLQPRPQAVLLVRAQSGRQRLIEWLRRRGAGVEEAVAYRRVAHQPGEAQWAALIGASGAGTRLAVLYTSSEAVAAVAAQFADHPVAADLLGDEIALCIHERIERELRARGRTDVRRCDLDPASIRAALRHPPASDPAAPNVDLLL
jgi:uroporphyrinogen-III synthase